MINPDRLTTANKVIDAILPNRGFNISLKNRKLYLDYIGYNDKNKSILVRLRKNSLIFQYRRLPLGFTHESAIGLLVRWIRDEPCRDIKIWERWCSEGIGMKPKSIIDILVEAGYPQVEMKEKDE